ncbi:hypothetical protein [Rhodovulum euryhalinum]|uniref:Uncharacterized protein n=1 Tax=Rhodovulum euryhalinum TaxID=35805 RepID=A0A4R2KI66_9RHOB|nr:hypothetical protein [Rhodovulum euryhalinum]TCO72864.1 hypothetical protein EV655_10393 [Rhodovulum euryhalinum]
MTDTPKTFTNPQVETKTYTNPQVETKTYTNPVLESKLYTNPVLSTGSTPLSDMMKWALISSRGSAVELKTDDPTPFSKAMKWPLLSEKATMFDSELTTPGSASSGNDSGFNKFIRSIVSGEPQK